MVPGGLLSCPSALAPVAGCAEGLKVGEVEAQVPPSGKRLDVIDVQPCAVLGRCAAEGATRILDENFKAYTLPFDAAVKAPYLLAAPPECPALASAGQGRDGPHWSAGWPPGQPAIIPINSCANPGNASSMDIPSSLTSRPPVFPRRNPSVFTIAVIRLRHLNIDEVCHTWHTSL